MTIYTWPEGVPKNIYGYKKAINDNRVVTESDSGIVLQYAKNTFVPQSYSFGLHLTDAQEAIFMDWVRNTLNGGAGYFYFSFTENGAQEVVRFKNMPDSDGSTGFKDVQCEIEEVGL